MIEKSECCQKPYIGQWVGLKLIAICSHCRKKKKDLGYLIIYEDNLIEKEIKTENLEAV